MTIRFAGPAAAIAPRLDRSRARAAAGYAANDNGGSAANEAMFDAALRHFAQYGLAAAHRARSKAEAAFFAGDREGYQWWLEICRTLDRRMAGTVEGSRQRG